MDDILKLLMTAVTPPWNYVLAGIGLALLVGPRLAELPNVFYDFKSRRRVQIVEKERLEILKLRYEIEAIKKQHNLPDLVLPAPPEKMLPKREEIPAAVPLALSWLFRYPRLGKPLLVMSQSILGFFLFIFGLSVVTGPLVLIPELKRPLEASDVGMLIVLPLTYGLLAWGCYAAFKRVRRWKVEIAKNA